MPRDDPKSEMAAISEETYSQTVRYFYREYYLNEMLLLYIYKDQEIKPLIFFKFHVFTHTKITTIEINTLKPVYVIITSVKQSPVLKGDIFLSCHRNFHMNRICIKRSLVL